MNSVREKSEKVGVFVLLPDMISHLTGDHRPFFPNIAPFSTMIKDRVCSKHKTRFKK